MYKLLIVDDEALIREGIRSIAQAHFSVFTEIFEAGDGEEALKMALDLVPDIIISDIHMPRMNGIEFIEIVKNEIPDMKMIIISGYDDFEYAQKAIQFKVQDYLLKPVPQQVLVEKLKNIVNELNSRNLNLQDIERLQQKVNESRPIMRERFYRELLEGKLKPAELDSKCKALDIQWDSCFYVIAILKIKSLLTPGEKSDSLLTNFLVKESAERLLQETVAVDSFFISDHHLALLIGSNLESKEKAFAAVNIGLLNVSSRLPKTTRVEVTAAVGKMYNSPWDLHYSYIEAKESLLHAISPQHRNIIHYEEIGSNPSAEYQKTVALADQLVLHVKLQEEEKAVQLLNELFLYYKTLRGLNPRWLKMSMMEIAVKLLHLLEGTGIHTDSIFLDKEADPYENIYRIDDLKDLQDWSIVMVKKCLLEMERKRANRSITYIEKVKEFIVHGLSDKNLSINEIASRLFLNPNYLRQLFKQQTGESFVEYVTRFRMEAAVELLSDPTMKIQEVAEKVGFEEQRYFSSCFKKFHQMTPSEYRAAWVGGLLAKPS